MTTAELAQVTGLVFALSARSAWQRKGWARS